MQKYPSINGLRAISIILVIIHHLVFQKYHVFEPLANIVWLAPLVEFLQDGQLGVNIFFVISGFLITSLLLQEEINATKISLKNFFLRRTLRIFPAYFYMLFIYFILQLFHVIYITDSSWLAALLYLKDLGGTSEWYTIHSWSLSVEEHFYLLWPLVFMAGPTFRKCFSIALIILVPLIRIYVHLYPIDWMTDLTIYLRIDAIATGCFFALYKDSIIKFLSISWNTTFYFSIICLFFLRYYPMFVHKIHIGFITIPFGITYGTFANALIALLMMYSVFVQKGFWFNFLNLRILNYIGILSYSLYLWQQFFIYKTDNWYNQFPANIGLLIATALFSYYIIEKPFLNLKQKFKAKENHS